MTRTRLRLAALGPLLLPAAFGAGLLLARGPGGTADEVSAAFQAVAAGASSSVVSVHAYDRGRRTLRPRSQGSGVAVAEGGVVLTNHHVVAGADELKVLLADGTRLEAELVGADPLTDLAVLRVADGALEPMSLRRAPARVGEWVLAIGNPSGLGLSVTAGIVSGTGRADLGVTTYEDFVQTDAAINAGNSGGPLVDLDGALLGVNTAMGTQQGGTTGLGFAIPVHVIQPVMDELLSTGQMTRGWLGVFLATRTEAELEGSGYRGPCRAAVTEVVAGSPAAQGGLRAGDLVLRVAGRDVLDHNQVLEAVAALDPGAEVALEVWRDRAVLELAVVLGDRRDAGDR